MKGVKVTSDLIDADTNEVVVEIRQEADRARSIKPTRREGREVPASAVDDDLHGQYIADRPVQPGDG